MGKKTCEICGIETFTDKHHIVSKSKGGSNHPSNLTNLCPNCHRAVHMGEIILESKFMTTDGMKLFWHNKNEENFTGNEAEVYLFK